ncbi:MAG: S-layer homology domain-containing protein [Ruminiclostridium sp.]|nr:S-layer homology domain-containing protein [Ruminiclostridium sp.]
MRLKRFTAAALSAVLAASSVGIYAEAAEDKTMKTELTYVKERLTIPEALTDFNYSTGTYMDKTQYNFKWNDPDNKWGNYMNVSIIGRVIRSVEIYNENTYSWERSFAKMSEAKLREAAKKYINAINPTITDQVEILDDTFRIYLEGNSAVLRFRRSVNGVPVTGQTGSVTVNKNTGELMSYRFNWINGATFSSAEDAISLEDAQKAYRKVFGSELIYTYSTEWDSETRKSIKTPHLIYNQTDDGQINAFTGEKSTFEDYGYYDDDDYDIGDDDAVIDEEMAMAADDNNGAQIVFTPEEKEKLEKEDSLIKAEQELADLKKLGIFYLPDSVEVDSQYCNFNEEKGAYIRNVTFTVKYADFIDLNNEEIMPRPANLNTERTVYGNFRYNAETGELYYFSNYYNDTGNDLTADKAKAKAISAARKLLGKNYDRFAALEQTSDMTLSARFDKETGEPVPGTPRTTRRYYSANRVENKIKCREEYYNITVANNGYVSEYSVTFNEGLEYPKPENIITKAQAYKSFFDQVEYDLKYRCAYDTKNKKVVSALVYAASNSLRIDAFTGKMTSYNGEELPAVSPDSDYTDLEGSKYAAYAKKLASYGIKLMDENGRLDENSPITAGDFRKLLNYVGFYSSYYDEPDEDDDSTETTKSLAQPKDTDKLRRRTAAQILVTSSLGYSGTTIAELPGIYRSTFSDVKDTSAYIGYIEIADAAGLLTGTKGKFYPKAYFTRGAAIKLIYDMLNK